MVDPIHPLHQVPDEGEPLPLDEEHEAPAFATVRLVDVQVSMGSHDTAWHPEMKAGMTCSRCQKHTLKRHKNTVYCGFCKHRWWSKKPTW